ncbi:hypothetical protein KSP39_PZI002338 [Platanthera zijinensis]|uniref:Uncharacterized protein n=1 Tax=Platanthera zijinensis TaxID=2320716 RepID=A0AAP0GEJ3_9ASPA
MSSTIGVTRARSVSFIPSLNNAGSTLMTNVLGARALPNSKSLLTELDNKPPTRNSSFDHDSCSPHKNVGTRKFPVHKNSGREYLALDKLFTVIIGPVALYRTFLPNSLTNHGRMREEFVGEVSSSPTTSTGSSERVCLAKSARGRVTSLLKKQALTGRAPGFMAPFGEQYLGRGIYSLYDDVKSCPCEDVHVLWSILVEQHSKEFLPQLSLKH